MKNPSIRPPGHCQGSALLIVLAFLLLLTTLTVAFLSRATLERQLSNASFSQGKVDLAGQGAISAIIGDLQREIIAGSNGTGTPSMAGGYYYPTAPATAIPALVVPGYTSSSIVGTGVEDLLKISQRATPFWSGANYSAAGPIRAAPVSTVNNPSLNNRSVSDVRWNKPLLMNPINVATTVTDFTPPAAFTSNPPDWIYVARDGSNPTTWDSSYEYLASVSPTTAPVTGTPGYDPVTQRYAYAIYDEGSTLDLNVAGSPATGTATATYSVNQPYKNALAYADLTQLPGIGKSSGGLSALSAANQVAFINAIVGWRNYASAQATGTFPGTYTFAGATSPSVLTPFDLFITQNVSGFLNVGNAGLLNGPNVTGSANQSDNAFTSRQQMLQFFLQGLGQNSTLSASLANLESALPYLGTFSRDLSQPSYAPDPSRPVVVSEAAGGNDMAGQAYSAAGQNLINPAFLNLAATSTFIRNDGSTAVIGEPLVKKRFALMRLAWLTYMGPSADRTIPTSNPGSTSPNYDLWLLVNNYGIPASFLAEGTDANIVKYFGLEWLGPNNPYSVTSDSSTSIGIGDGTQKWKYIHGTKNSGSSPTTSGSPGRIMNLTQVQSAGRDADFFELLKAAVTVGSIAKPGTAIGSYQTVGGFQNLKDSSVDAYIIQLGANIIDQSKTDNYSTRIIFDDGTTFAVPQEYRGIKDLPYIYRTRGQHIKTNDSTPNEVYDQGTPQTNITNVGSGVYLEVPEIWDPHTWNTSVTPSSGISPLGAATTPNFQMVAFLGDPIDIALGTTATFSITGVPISRTDGNYGAPATQDPNTGDQQNVSFSGQALTFSIPATAVGAGMFRESTLLNKPNVPTGSSTAGAANNPTITSWYKSAAYTASAPSSVVVSTDNQSYLGFNCGTFPLWYKGQPTTTNYYEITSIDFNVGNGVATYRLEYPDPITPGKYDIYDEKFLPFSYTANYNSHDNAFMFGTQNTAVFSTASQPYYCDPIGIDNYTMVVDPRTARFSAATFTTVQSSGEYLAPPGTINSIGTAKNWYGWIDASQNAVMSGRPDYYPGWAVISPPSALGFYTNPAASTMYAGLLSQNSTSTYSVNNGHRFINDGQGINYYASANVVNQSYYADADGVVRRATAGYITALGTPSSPYSLPSATSTTYTAGVGAPTATQNGNRPVMLNRPFRSVADLGYTFSGTPWRNIDFATPESGYAAMLDVFCINDTNNPNGLVAGKVNLNTRQSAVLNAVLSGAYKDEYNNTTTGISSADASAFITDASNGLIVRTGSIATGKGPLRNVSELVGKWVTGGSTTVPIDGSVTSNYSGFSGDLTSNSSISTSSTPSMSYVQRFHESAIRALSNAGTTRVWNLMIDVIAQTGRFPSSATGLANFNVEGERRYWVHLAIDRYTGKILDEQIEEVKE